MSGGYELPNLLKKSDLETHMLFPTVVTTQTELEEIYALNLRNLKQNLDSEEKNQEGFVTWLYEMPLLQELHRQSPAIIAKDSETQQVVGYALVALQESAPFHPDLADMIEHVRDIPYQGKTIADFTHYFMGQVCIDKAYRGKGIFRLLYEHHRTIYRDQYQLLITEISTANIRSQKAHEKVGFRTIYSHTDPVDHWNVVAWDWS